MRGPICALVYVPVLLEKDHQLKVQRVAIATMSANRVFVLVNECKTPQSLVAEGQRDHAGTSMDGYKLNQMQQHNFHNGATVNLVSTRVAIKLHAVVASRSNLRQC